MRRPTLGACDHKAPFSAPDMVARHKMQKLDRAEERGFLLSFWYQPEIGSPTTVALLLHRNRVVIAAQAVQASDSQRETPGKWYERRAEQENPHRG